MTRAGPLLAVEGLSIAYGLRDRPILAVGDVSFDLRHDEVLGLIGESGSGKSTLTSGIIGMLRSTGRVTTGNILFGGRNLRALSRSEWRRIRWREIAYVPQGAMNVLNPVRRIRKQFLDIVHDHGFERGSYGDAKLGALLESVRLPARLLDRYPHELSGGMRQRICIAMAIMFEPALIVADEPTSALDVVSQRVVAETIEQVRRQAGASMIFVGHDLALQAQVAHRIGIMYKGHLLEIGETRQIFDRPGHPYTRRLIDAVPSIHKKTGLASSALPTSAERAHWDQPLPLCEIEPGHWVAGATT